LHNLRQKLGDGHGLATLPDARIEGRLKKQTIYAARDFSMLHLASKVGAEIRPEVLEEQQLLSCVAC
jgi:hypothetical protein